MLQKQTGWSAFDRSSSGKLAFYLSDLGHVFGRDALADRHCAFDVAYGGKVVDGHFVSIYQAMVEEDSRFKASFM
jgi:hypothetical protein